MQQNKRGYFFSLDALIALIVIIGVVLLIKPAPVQISKEMNLQEDLLKVLSDLKVGEINNNEIKNLIADGNITDLNKSVLEQIGEFYALENPEAGVIANDILANLDLNKNIGLYFENTPVAVDSSISFSEAEKVYTSRQIISGIQGGNATSGYSAVAYLAPGNKVGYFYFGGYVGDGNITVNLGERATSAKVEAVFSEGFNVFVNGIYQASYNPTPGIPFNFTVSGGFAGSGENSILFTSNNSLYIAGGFIKITYSEPQVLSTTIRHKFPGIDGLINLYSSIYVPGSLNTMNIFLHYNSEYNIFLSIGNKTVYLANSSGNEMTVDLTNAELSSVPISLDYNQLSYKTIPVRLGLDNVSYFINTTSAVDVISVNDLSASMKCSRGINSNCYFSRSYCVNTCSGVWDGPINASRNATKAFIDIMLNDTTINNRVGLAGYSTNAESGNTHALSQNNVSLKNEVNSWIATGGTCICCGINRAKNMIATQSPSNKSRSIVIMSDGAPTYYCSNFDDYTGAGTGNTVDTSDITWAINAAANAYNNFNITVHTIGFGETANQTILQNIAAAGHGNYYYGNIDDIIDIYKQVATDVIKGTYLEQTVEIEGDLITKLYPDSYISVSYDKVIPWGMVINAETDEFNNSNSIGNFTLPANTTPYEIKVVSYSGSRWTDSVETYNNNLGIWESVFDLSDYGSDYILLGDPYIVNVPLDKIIEGDNSFRVRVGLSPFNSSAGSPYNKIVYSVVKNLSSFSPIVPVADGCRWDIEFEDSTSSIFNFPSDYAGVSRCSYNSTSVAYNSNDAIDNAIYSLLVDLDLDSDHRIETRFDEEDLSISTETITGIPFTWETEVQARVWE